MAKTDEYTEARNLERRLESIEKAYQEELKASPDELKTKRDAKIRDAIAKASPEARSLLIAKGKIAADGVAAATKAEEPATPAQTESAQRVPEAMTGPARGAQKTG